MDESPSTNRTCGHATKSGKPCKQVLYGHDVACKLHATKHDHALAAARKEGWEDGFARGSELGAGAARIERQELERLREKVKDLERRLEDASRYYEIDGDQVVEVEGYGYRWSGADQLKVGDRVLLPENYVSVLKRGRGPIEGTVTKLGSTYRGGDLSRIIRRIHS
ncbi:hypothetical protein [Actinoallomurus sp. CA-150999]|uniref:hypothetical protein n=1 Tax=Actinoallomurus sp. CA-150999 TaxID=3239887 RepID=UPI003D901724